MKRICFLYITLLCTSLLFVVACKDDQYSVPAAGSELSNDGIKRTIGPNLVGSKIEFAYAMAIPAGKGKITSAQVEASIAGATGTYLENNSYYTNGSGIDVGIPIGSPSITNGAITTVTFNKDTSAATLRYYYVIPETARGQSVSFTFSANSSDGGKVTYALGPYTVSSMDMVLDLNVVDGAACYISIADMAVYAASAAASIPDKIDLVYLYRATPASFSHALVSPVADPIYLPGVTLPAGVTRNTKISKAWNLRDFNLARLQYGVYIDDLDFQQLNISEAPNFALNLKAEAGAWVETSDGKYRAYIYINSVTNSTKSAKISIKRYTF
ncbi:DUF4466 family protein [Arcticibacter eurypsychrophilus]|uniref:DUF4466 family protein n=1 Tax=Arcticibacter eurypsychrophilus TaxID=1434752 RepID=UPI00084D60E7|nr:DUF4466 family protein [Arcticibacter eurypsychrophilus]